MSKKLLGLMLGATLMGGVAFAEGDKAKDQQAGTEMESSESIGGSGQAGQTAQQQNISGEVVKANKNAVYLKSDQGAVVELKVQKDTKFTAADVKSAKDLKEGQQVRASFEVKGSENIAKDISLDEGMGGSGFEEQEPLEPGLEPDLGTGTQDDIGGSGTEVEPAPEPEPGLQY